MLAFSVYQPYASLLAIGAKRWETRPIRISKKHGPVAIAACAKSPVDCLMLLQLPHFRRPLEAAGLDPDNLPMGCVLAFGRAEEAISTKEWIRRHCRKAPMKYQHEQEYLFGDYSPGRFANFFPQVTRLPRPVPCRGNQGLWPVSAELEEEIMLAVAAGAGPGATVCGGTPPY